MLTHSDKSHTRVVLKTPHHLFQVDLSPPLYPKRHLFHVDFYKKFHPKNDTYPQHRSAENSFLNEQLITFNVVH